LVLLGQLSSTDLRHFHLQQLAELLDLAGDVTEADSAVVGRAVHVPRLDELPRADGEAVAAVGVAISRIGPGTDSPSATSSLSRPSTVCTTERSVTGRA